MISYFNKIDRTAVPVKSISLQESLKQIQKSDFQQLIELSRKSGKNSPTDFLSGTYYINYDEYGNMLKSDYIVEGLNNIFDNNPSIDIVFFSEKYDSNTIKGYLNKFKIKYSNVVTIVDFYSFFEQKLENIAFISLVWGGFDKLKQEKTGKKGTFNIVVRNLYNYVKSVKTPVVTWNAEFSEKRALKSVTKLSGYIYMDIDDFTEKSESEVYNILTDNGLNFIKAVWKSFGGYGYGFLVHVDGLTLDNFKNNWVEIAKKFQSFGIKVDKATKDVTRINVLSYDENIFIRETTTPIIASNVLPETLQDVKVEPLADDLKLDVFEQIISGLYYDASYYNTKEDRLSYNFYQVLFSKTNHVGIPLNEVINILDHFSKTYPKIYQNFKYSKSSIIEIGKKQYDSYGDQFATIRIEHNKIVSDDYILLGLYKKFEGDVQLQLQELYEKAIKKESETQGIIVYLAWIAKRTGILSKDVIEYIEKKFGYNPQNIMQVKKIYSNPNYHFGLDVKLKESVKERKRAELISKYELEGKTVIVSDLISGEQTRLPLQTIYNKVIGNTRVTEKNVIFLLKKYFNETNSYGISLLDASNFIKKECNFHSIDRYVAFYGQFVYKNQIFFGLRFANYESDKKKIEANSLLKNNEKLSDLKLKISDKTILWADTGMGKTTWACSELEGKRIILVPTIGALKNIETKYGAATFYEAKKEVSPLDEIIVSTYSSFPKLFNLIQSWEGGVGEYILIFDEQHNLAVSAEKNYRNSELNFVLDNLHFFKQRIFLTGTFFPVLHPEVNDLNIHRIKWQDTIKKNATVIWYEDKYKAVEQHLVKGKKNIIYLQDKRMHKQLGKLLAHLKNCGWTGIYLLNANEKNEPHFKNLITSEYLESDAQVIITTSVTVEAINILDLDVETVHFLSFENPRLMEQMVNRMRRRLPSNIYIYKKTKKEGEEIAPWFDPVQAQKDLVDYSKGLLLFLSKPKQKKTDSYDKVSAQKLFANQIFEKSAFFRVKEQKWDVDYLSIAYKVFNEETIYAKKNFDYFSNILKEYGWEFNLDIIHTNKISKAEIDAIALEQERLEEEMEVYALNVLTTVKKQGLEKLRQEIEKDKTVYDNTKYPDIEWSVRIKALKLSKYMDFIESCVLIEEWIKNHKRSENKFEKIMREIAVKIARLSGALDSTVNFKSKFSESVVKLYFEEKPKGLLYTKEQLTEFFNRRKKMNDTLVGLDGEKYAIDIFSKYFEVLSVLEGKEIKFKLGGLNVMNDVSIFTKKFYEWADTALNCELLFTSTELTDVLNNFRADLPFLKKFKLNTKQTLRLIEDYCTVKKTTKRENGKPITSYKITDLEPALTKHYNIKINQEVFFNNTQDIFYTNLYEKNNGIQSKSLSGKNIRHLANNMVEHVNRSRSRER